MIKIITNKKLKRSLLFKRSENYTQHKTRLSALLVLNSQHYHWYALLICIPVRIASWIDNSGKRGCKLTANEHFRQ